MAPYKNKKRVTLPQSLKQDMQPLGPVQQPNSFSLAAASQPDHGTAKLHRRDQFDQKKSSDNPKNAKLKALATVDEKNLVPYEYDPVQSYLSEIRRYELLTREEEIELGIRIQEHGDQDAIRILVVHNLRLVVKIAFDFQRVWMQNLQDLIQEGSFGLIHAARKFDPYRNVRFSYYASFWIKNYIRKFIMDNSRLVKIGTTQGQRKLFYNLRKEEQKLIEQGFDPEPKLLSNKLGVTEKEIIDMSQRLDGPDSSLNAPAKEDSQSERLDFISHKTESVEEILSKKEIEAILREKVSIFRKQLTCRELEIFDQRIFSDSPATLQDIGDRYKISRERVRQVEKSIIERLRNFIRDELPDFDSYIA